MGSCRCRRSSADNGPAIRFPSPTETWRRAVQPRLAPLWVGLVLTVQPLGVMAADWIYTVVPGDNLWDLSERYLDSPARFEQIRRLNNVEFPRRMQPGTRLRVPMKWIRSNPVPAQLAALRGAAMLIRSDGSRIDPVPAGTELRLGDVLKTGADSSAAVRFADGSVLTLHAASEMRFDHLSAHGETGMVDSRLHLLDGRVDTRVEPAVGPGSRFEIQTPSAISAVRGTEYRAAVIGEKASTIEVLEGSVSVSGARRPRLIAGGFGTRVEAGEAPAPPRRLLPPPAIDGLPERIRELNWTLSWQALDDARAYRVEIAADAAFDVLLWERRSERPRVPLPDLPDGDYQVRVRGIDALGLEGRDRVLALTIDARPQPPVPLQPNDGRVLRGTVAELRWSDSADAEGYLLEVAADRDFNEVLLSRSDLDGTRLEAGGLDQPAVYYWRVSSIAADGEVGPPGSVRSWEVKPVPEAVEPSLAADEDRLVASWRPGRPGQGYQVQVALDPDFEELELDRRLTEPRLALDQVSGQVRYLRVRAIEPDGYAGPWGAVQRIDPPADPTGWMVPVIGILGLLLL